MILAADVGGTKTMLGLFRRDGGRLHCVREDSLPSQDFRSFEALVDAFRSGARARIRRCGVGVAGPVVAGRSQRVNLKWSVDERRLAEQLGTPAVRVINDLEATAWGIPVLPRSKLASLTPGLRAQPGNAAVVAAGTGLGMAIMIWDGERWHPGASEGGHQSFGPRSDLEIELLRFLRRRHGRVSVERVVSGPALSSLYEFLHATGRGRGSHRERKRFPAGDDPNAAIARAGLSGADPVASAALDLFVSLYGAVAGDLALVARATAGLYVGGGIAPKILPRLRAGGFLRAFRDKGRLRPLVERIPVRVILEPRTALLGAAQCAASWHPSGRRVQSKKR